MQRQGTAAGSRPLNPDIIAVVDDQRIYTTCEHAVSFVLFDFARSPYGYYSVTTPSKVP